MKIYADSVMNTYAMTLNERLRIFEQRLTNVEDGFMEISKDLAELIKIFKEEFQSTKDVIEEKGQ